jgi:RNA polymerase sigma-70 factor (ECF subfamily)
MTGSSSTCWTAIRSAAAGDDRERSRFAQRYQPVIRAYLAARWRNPGWRSDLEDTAQEVLFECLKEGGALEVAAPGRPGGFRAFLHGICRNVAARHEAGRRQRREIALAADDQIPDALVDDSDLTRVFDQAWARMLVSEAAGLQARRARRQGGDALRRLEVLELRFDEGLAIRDIARRQERDAAQVHYDYSRARKDFHLALREVVAFHLPGAETGIDKECERLLELLEAG